MMHGRKNVKFLDLFHDCRPTSAKTDNGCVWPSFIRFLAWHERTWCDSAL